MKDEDAFDFLSFLCDLFIYEVVTKELSEVTGKVCCADASEDGRGKTFDQQYRH